MGSEKVVAKAAMLRRLRGEDAGLGVLRADLMPVSVAVLAERLGGLVRQLPAVEFLQLLTDDLDELRGIGFDLPRTATDYFSEWVRAGVLVRRAGAGRDETVEMSPAAQVAVRFAAGLDAQHSGVTASRLANVADLLGQLARDTDTEQEGRLRALLAERAAIDEQIRQVEAGEFVPIDASTALERLAEALRLAQEIPGDFAKVSADMEALNHSLREQIINAVGSRGDVLEKVFAGVDLIETSDAGRTFDAFYAMVLDPERSETFDDVVSAVLGRDFADALTDDERWFLHALLAALQKESAQVRQAMTGFSRSLRGFVQTHAYLEQRALREAIGRAQVDVLELARRARLTTSIGYGLPATSCSPSSIGSWRLHNPADVRAAEPVAERPIGVLDVDELRRRVRLSEIDFDELRRGVADVVARRGAASIGEVLADHPPTQGLASVVGMLALASSAGSVGAGTEELTWFSLSGLERNVSARRYVFDEVPESWARHTEVMA